ncbi:LuxR family transcriptional regulator [Thiorhodococcus mannitoliphagus]|uniref:LuxR family transcriptional regulator n=1 Tax=Thiorhodococcus mannitoliphagus TaxID=329406 RepID=A0A6P1E151_9GAMM|nr:LuxR C-terminal-related transcriptional regulator [Thiorhodococcus mannitoliphagus]NEX23520.1 LuxR family transcriptional regulator [Thiorhodococcus mannitoliphagus]
MRNQTAAVIPLAFMLLSAITLLGLVDLGFDLRHGVSRFHLISEIAILLLSLGSICWLGSVWARTRDVAVSATDVLDRHRLGLAENIESQLRAWGLTKAESCVAMFLLKGISHQKIASCCNRSERTIRQHAVAVYQKSGLAGRAELAAFFIEDLLPPHDSRDGLTQGLATAERRQSTPSLGRKAAPPPPHPLSEPRAVSHT